MVYFAVAITGLLLVEGAFFSALRVFLGRLEAGAPGVAASVRQPQPTATFVELGRFLRQGEHHRLADRALARRGETLRRLGSFALALDVALVLAAVTLTLV